MPFDDIKRLPVGELAAKNAHLHLWATSSFLREALALIDAWGFEYKSCLVWIKDQIGMGNYWRMSHEYLRLGVRGSLRFRNRSRPSWVGARRNGHRRKPGVFRRVLNSFLQFLEQDDSDSLVVAATNYVDMLDEALFRRFDDVIEYVFPTPEQVKTLIENRLSPFGLGRIAWPKVKEVAAGISHAEVARACDDAAKDCLLSGKDKVTTQLLVQALSERSRGGILGANGE